MPLTDYVTLGRSGLRVSPLCLGAMTFGEDWGWGASVAESESLLSHYLDRGGNFIDTANGYTKGHSERIIGDAISHDRSRRDRIVIATKFSTNLYSGDPNAGGASRKNIVASCEQSLRRLRTDYIDLYWMHFWDPHTPIDETMRALDDLVRAGKVRYIGASNFAGSAAAASCTHTRPSANPGISKTEVPTGNRTDPVGSRSPPVGVSAPGPSVTSSGASRTFASAIVRAMKVDVVGLDISDDMVRQRAEDLPDELVARDPRRRPHRLDPHADRHVMDRQDELPEPRVVVAHHRGAEVVADPHLGRAGAVVDEHQAGGSEGPLRRARFVRGGEEVSLAGLGAPVEVTQRADGMFRIHAADENIRNSTRATDFMTPKTPAAEAFSAAALGLARDHAFARAFVNSGRLSVPCDQRASTLTTPDEDAFAGDLQPGDADHRKRHEEAQRGRGLDPRGVVAALAIGRMLGHVGGGATVLTAQRQALQQAQRDQNDRGGHADGGVVGQDADDEGRQAHDQDGDQEGVLATDHVAQAAKHQRAKGAHDEACGKSQQREDEGRTRIQATEKLLGNDRGQRSIQVKVIPLEHGAERRCKNHLLLFRGHRTCCLSCRHRRSPIKVMPLPTCRDARFLEEGLSQF